MLVRDKSHNEQCTVYALGCAFQNTKDSFKDNDTLSKMLVERFNRGESIAQYLVSASWWYFDSELVGCHCSDGPPETWSSAMRETYALGMLFYLCNHNPDTTGRI